MQCVVLFLAEENITAATTKVYGTVAGIRVPFKIDNPNACEDQGITCPMIAGKDYTFKTVLPIKSMYPSVSILEILASSQQTSLVPSRPRRFRSALDSTSSLGRFSLALEAGRPTSKARGAPPWGRGCARFQASSAVQSDSGNEMAWGRGSKCLAELYISNTNSTKGPICTTSSIFPNFIAATHLCEQNALHCTFLGVKNSFQFKCNGNSLL